LLALEETKKAINAICEKEAKPSKRAGTSAPILSLVSKFNMPSLFFFIRIAACGAGLQMAGPSGARVSGAKHPLYVCVVLFVSVAAQRLSLDVAGDGSFNISHDGNPLLSGSEVMVGSYSNKDGLKSRNATKTSGTDALGAFTATTLAWYHTDNASKVLMETSFRSYASDDGMIVFEQRFPTELNAGFDFGDEAVFFQPAMKATDGECRVVTGDFKLHVSDSTYDAFVPSSSGFDEHDRAFCGDSIKIGSHAKTAFEGILSLDECKKKCTDLKCTCVDSKARVPPPPGPSPGPSPSPGSLSARTLFPGFSRAGPADDFNCFSYQGIFASLVKCKMSSYKESHQGGAPLTIYDKTNASLPMVVFSPLNFPKASHMASTSELIGAGEWDPYDV
jgi:hypothetical protein